MDGKFMLLALAEAKKGARLTAPNPAVGALVLKNGRVLAKGNHRRAGLPHAEIEAIRKLTPAQLRGATLYVTLEPCSSHGRTPPCTDAIVEAGIERVVYGITDPDPRHSGRASRILRKAGLLVTEGVNAKTAEACAELNRHWNHRISTGLPWVIAKAGMSLDGKLDSPPHRRWITSAASRRESMRLRASVEAIIVGGGTIRADDPSLTIRGIRIPEGRLQPWRVVWSRSGKLPKKARIFTDAHRDRTIVIRGTSLRGALRELGRRGISSVLIEGGGRTLGEAFDRKLVDEIRFFIAPVIQGGLVPAVGGKGAASNEEGLRLEEVTYRKFGSDLMISARVLKK